MPKQPYSIKVGDRFGKLIVLKYGGYDKSGSNPIWICRCDCGSLVQPTQCNLATGNSKGCSACKWAARVKPDGSLRRAFRTYRRQAEQRDLCFELTFEQFTEIVTSRCCFYCGAQPVVNSYSHGSKIPVAMLGVDRQDSRLGYTFSNCLPCCSTCNQAKHMMTAQEFVAWIRRVAAWLETHNAQ